MVKQKAIPRHEQGYDSSQFVSLDEGHALVKGSTDTTWWWFVHALMPITDNDWDKLKQRSQPGEEYYVVNGQPYVIGETAERKGWTGRLQGAARYKRDYYGVMGAIMMFQLFKTSQRSITVYATHAPEYIDYRDKIAQSLMGEWEVESMGAKRTFNIKDVLCCDEPVAGAMNVMLADKGAGFAREALQSGTGLVIDIGGYTTDATLLENGVPDYHSLMSEPGVGILSTLEEFKRDLRARYSEKLSTSSRLRPEKLRQGLATGIYHAGGYGDLDCQEQADIACNRLSVIVSDIYSRHGGKSELDYLIMTGGGSGLLFDRLKRVLDHPAIHLANSPEYVHMANVVGAMKLMHFYKRHGAF